MQHAARHLLVGGTAAAVIGLGLAHATIHDEVYFRSFRLWWALAYIILLCASAYAAGLPNLVPGRQASVAALGAVAVAAVGMSLFQLVAGTALLPRFVVFAAALTFIPWFVLCTALALQGSASRRCARSTASTTASSRRAPTRAGRSRSVAAPET